MSPLIGRALLVLCLPALATTVALYAAVLRGRAGLHRPAAVCAVVSFVGAAAAGIVLLLALLRGDTSFAYVVQNWDPGLSVAYRIAAFWAAQAGSLLFWAILSLAATLAVAARAWRSRDPLDVGAVLVLAAADLFLVALMVFDGGSDPFATATGDAVPLGMNPLLLHPAMALHPPALFLGYACLTVPFAYALVGFRGPRTDARWARRSRPWALGGWLFLTLGIGLGAWWAYVILSWGGFWGWDPVENTSLVPWLTATALVHSLAVYTRSATFRRWSAALAVLTFWFVLLAVWTTRTGVVASVHAFERRTLFVVLLTGVLVGVAALGGVVLVRGRRPAGQSGRALDLSGQDLMHEVADVVLVAFAVALAFATVAAPLLFGQHVRADTYDLLAQPLGIVTVLGVGICALLGGSGGRRALLVRSAGPVGMGVLAAFVVASTGWGGSALGLTGLAVCVFAGMSSLEWLGLRARRLVGDGRRPSQVCRALLSNRRSTAGFVVHVGIAVLLAGLLGADVYEVQQRVELPAQAGATVAVGEYRLVFQGYSEAVAPQSGERILATLRVEHEGRQVGTVSPAFDYYGVWDQAVPRAAIFGSAWEDLFVSPESFAQEAVELQVIVFPLVRLMWAGAGLLVVGGALGLLPRRRRAATSGGGLDEDRDTESDP